MAAQLSDTKKNSSEGTLPRVKDENENEKNSDPHGNPRINLENLVVDFKTTRALDHVSFSVRKGEIFCLLGPNGAGKTTIIRVLTGQLRTYTGTVHVLGKEPCKQRKEVIFQLGLVPQEIALYKELTGRENLEFHARLYNTPKEEISTRVDALLSVAGLTDRQHDQVSTYSGGMMRRLQLIRALVHDPEILFLDEPTLGVDVQSRNAIHDYIRKLPTRGKTVVLTTNYMEEAQKLATRLVILDGKVIEGPANLQEIQARTLPGNILEFQTPEREGLDALIDTFVHDDLHGKIMHVNTDGERISYQISFTRRSAEVGLERLLAFMKKNNLVVQGLLVKQPDLEDIFLHLTGKEFRD